MANSLYSRSGFETSSIVLNRRSSNGNATRYVSLMYFCTSSWYLNRFRWSARTFGSCLIFILFSASCRPQHASQKNLFLWQSISLALNCRKQAVTLEFCSISMDKSKKDSSREDTFSQVRHRVSLVKLPSNIWWTNVPPDKWDAELELPPIMLCEASEEELTDLDKSSAEANRFFLSSCTSSTILFRR